MTGRPYAPSPHLMNFDKVEPHAWSVECWFRACLDDRKGYS